MPLQVLASEYEREWDEFYGDLARDLSRRVIDFNYPNAIYGLASGGPLYKWERIVHSLFNYYRATGDEAAREAILRALDYMYRFDFIHEPFYSTNHAAFLYSLAYEWTGNPVYERIVNSLIQKSIQRTRIPGSPETNTHPTMGIPAGLRLFADGHRPELPFPLAEYKQQPDVPETYTFHKPAGAAVTVFAYARFPQGENEQTPLDVQLALVTADGETVSVPGAEITVETVVKTRRCIIGNTHLRRYVEIVLPEDAPAGDYTVAFPGVEYVRIFDVR